MTARLSVLESTPDGWTLHSAARHAAEWGTTRELHLGGESARLPVVVPNRVRQSLPLTLSARKRADGVSALVSRFVAVVV